MSETVMRPQAARPDTEKALPSETLFAALLIGVALWPYSLVPPTYNLVFLGGVSAIAAAVRPDRQPRLPWQILAVLSYFFLIFLVTASTRGVNHYVLSQINHYFQFALYYYTFSKIAQQCRWERVISNPLFICICLASALVQYRFYNEQDVNITLMVALLGMFVAGQRSFRVVYFLLIVATLALVVISIDRISVLAVMVLFALLFWVKLPRIVTIALSCAIIVAPISFYLMMDPRTIVWLYHLDPNTGIRAEYIRGAASLLQQSPVFGVGFGGPYRPPNFPYVYTHNLLNDVGAVHIVSNHSSLFDVGLRLGVPAAGLFAWGIFRSGRGAQSRPTYALLSLMVAAGLSFNAWFENQAQLPQLVLALALVQAPIWSRQTARERQPGPLVPSPQSPGGV